MPTYEYRCADGHDFEKFVQKISLAVSELPCPVCGKVAPRRISAGGGLVFKGSGFYITDYGKDGKKDQRAKTDAAAAPGAAVAREGTGDTSGTSRPAGEGPAGSGAGTDSAGASTSGSGSGAGSTASAPRESGSANKNAERQSKPDTAKSPPPKPQADTSAKKPGGKD